MSKNKIFRSVLLFSIISLVLLGVSGCGYKDNPYYEETKEIPASDENVEFKIDKANK